MFTVLMIMTLTVLWLEPKSYERMIIVNLNFICHLLCIKDIYWELPKSGFNTPKLSKCKLIINRSFIILGFFVDLLENNIFFNERNNSTGTAKKNANYLKMFELNFI